MVLSTWNRPFNDVVAMAEALEQLGISPVYHMREVGKNKHQAAWVQAMEAKYEGKGEPFGREKFDDILGDFEVLLPSPASPFHC
jgi:hypothetical protein